MGKLSGKQAVQILEPVFHALTTIHSHGLLHRDISPDNIMLTEDGQVKLLDFGAARRISERDIKSVSVILKPGYSPEEQYRSKGKQGPWTDIYAICATIYYSMTGIVPDDAMERMFDDKLVPPAELDCDCTQKMSDVLMRGLCIRQADRHQSIQVLWNALNGQTDVPDDSEQIVPRKLLDAKTRISGAEWVNTEESPIQVADPITEERMAFPSEEQPVKPDSQTLESQKTPKKKHKLPILLGIGVAAAVLIAALIFALGSTQKNPGGVSGVDESIAEQEHSPAAELFIRMNSNSRIFARCWNDTNTRKPLANCSIVEISLSTEHIDTNALIVETPDGCILGKTTLSEFEAAAPGGTDSTVLECNPSAAEDTAAYCIRYPGAYVELYLQFDKNNILYHVTIGTQLLRHRRNQQTTPTGWSVFLFL